MGHDGGAETAAGLSQASEDQTGHHQAGKLHHLEVHQGEDPRGDSDAGPAGQVPGQSPLQQASEKQLFDQGSDQGQQHQQGDEARQPAAFAGQLASRFVGLDSGELIAQADE